MLTVLQVIAEGLPQLVKCLVVVCGVLYSPDWGLFIFLLAQVWGVVRMRKSRPNLLPSSLFLSLQLMYSLCYVTIYYGYFYQLLQSPGDSTERRLLPIARVTGIFPSKDGAGQWFSPYLTTLSWSFFKQSFLKQLLTDGELVFVC